MLEPAHAVRHYGQDAVALQAAWVGDPKAVLLVVPGALAMDLAHRHGNDGGGGLTKSAQAKALRLAKTSRAPTQASSPTSRHKTTGGNQGAAHRDRNQVCQGDKPSAASAAMAAGERGKGGIIALPLAPVEMLSG